jgi:hypothetical protein
MTPAYARVRGGRTPLHLSPLGIGIGGSLRRRPSHTTGHTGPYTAVRRINRFGGREGRQAERDEGKVGESEGQSGGFG